MDRIIRFLCCCLSFIPRCIYQLYLFVVHKLIFLGCALPLPYPANPGETANPVETGLNEVTQHFRRVLSGSNSKDEDVLLWQRKDSQILFYPQLTKIIIEDGFLLIGLTVETDQNGQVVISIPFALGNTQRMAGMVLATENKPRGPAQIVDQWGEALIAVAWDALLTVADEIAAKMGKDIRDVPLRAGAIAAKNNILIVVPQAQHVFEHESLTTGNL